jgi:two-component system chemotaxis response regulator CheB
VLLIDDSDIARRMLAAVLARDPDVQLVGQGADGEEAVTLAARERPDVILMDVNMPKMDGWVATRTIMESTPVPIVLISATYDLRDAANSFRALEAGAITLVDKPVDPSSPDFERQLAGLVSTVKVMAGVNLVTRRPRRVRAMASPSGPSTMPTTKLDVVAIGASTGGPAALSTILSNLPRDLPVPVLVVQHIAQGFEQGLVEWLASVCPLRVRFAAEGEALRSGDVLFAPSGLHLGVTRGRRVALSGQPPIDGHRPSATHLFRSVAWAYGPSALGVILTGMGQDGADGLSEVHDRGGFVVAQDESTSVVYGMPGTAVAKGVVDRILPIEQIPEAIERACGMGRGRATG